MKKYKRIFASPKRHENELSVQPGLALTPRDMDKMLREGQPISTANLPDNQFYDGDVNASFEIPLDQRRGIDPADLWEVQCEVSSKLKKGRKDSGNDTHPINPPKDS